MKSICGANCDECDLKKSKKCDGCSKTKGCPFGKKCFIADYIEIGGKENFELFKKQLIKEINNLNIDGMSNIDELYALNGSFVNLEYLLPNGKKVKFTIKFNYKILKTRKLNFGFLDKYITF